MQLGRSAFYIVALAAILIGVFSCTPEKANVLVFSKTEGFRHESIEAGITALEKMAAERGFDVAFTEDAADFYTANLQQYNAIVFLNTTGDVLDAEQQDAFERYIQAGGGYVGIHAATDTEYDWPWYGRLAGAYFLDHPSNPNVQTGTVVVKEEDHWATRGMPASFEKTDEFYNFRNISDKINVVLTLDESTYEGGKNGPGHPLSWYQEYDGGRAFYTAMGHTDETFSEPIFLDHLWAGIHYAAGGDSPRPLDYSKARPEENRFNKVVLAERLDEPMELTILDEDRVLFIQRKGEVRLYKNSTQELTTIANIPVNTVYVNEEGENSRAEDGLLGLNKDPNFAENQWIYLYYSSPEAPMNVLSRFKMDGDELVLDSEQRLLEVAVQRRECCHTGGSIAWDAAGNLYLSTGDNTNPHASNGYSPSDERPDRGPWDAQKSSANTNDLRGKVIRITPQPDGSYTIPEGNLFAEGTPQTRPEIYTMGHRNPYRISIDQKTGYLYWGDVGPDANQPDSTRGPAGHDEVGQARGPGNFGWPHFVGNNKPYWKYDFATEQSLEPWDPAAPMNTSPNNTGLTELPPAQPAFIWYPYGESPEFPLVGAGGRNAMAGPVYYREDFANAERAFPAYYDGKLFAYEWMRGWIMAVTMDEAGNYESMEPIMPNYTFNNPMDMAFAKNGDLYMLEYGTGWFTENDDARLVRIEYNAGNRKPQLQLQADKPGGPVPLTINLSADGTTDPDGDALSYTWEISSPIGYAETHTTPEVTTTLENAGVYEIKLTVDDGSGGVSTRTRRIVAGNAPPELQLAMAQGNRSFYSPGQAFDYAVTVNDSEDGTLETGIDPARVVVNIDYLAEGFDKVAIAQGHRAADDGAIVAKGKTLIDGSDCQSCHKRAGESIGPSYLKVAERYADDPGAVELLAGKIINGGGGVWGETAMAGHPQLTTTVAEEMVEYILSLTQETKKSSLPPRGRYVAELPEDDPGQGIFLVRAAYEDNGAPGLPSLRSEETLVLRNAAVGAHGYDGYEDIRKVSFGGNNMAIVENSGSYMLLENIDLTNVAAVVAMVVAPTGRMNSAGGTIEVRLDGPTGPLVGTSAKLEPGQAQGFAPTPLNIPLTLPAGSDGAFHDVYLVFKNEAAGDDSLMILFGTRYVISAANPEAMVQ